MTDSLTRRDFLTRAATTAVAASSLSVEARSAVPNLFDTLGKFQFMNEKGELVNMKALQASLKDQPITLSWGFDGCNLYCENATKILSDLGKKRKGNLTSIVINVQPESNLVGGSNFYASSLREKGGITHDLVTLFPLDTKKMPSGLLSAINSPNLPRIASESALIGPSIAMAFGETAKLKKPEDHIATIFLFNRSGRYLADKQSLGHTPEEFLNEWNAKLDVAPGQTR